MIDMSLFELQMRADKGQLLVLTEPFFDQAEGVVIRRGTVAKIEECKQGYVQVYFDRRGVEGLHPEAHPRYMVRWEWLKMSANLIEEQPTVQKARTGFKLNTEDALRYAENYFRLQDEGKIPKE